MRRAQPWKTNRARVLRSKSTSAEERMWYELRARLVEIDGGTHSTAEEIAKDAVRTAYLEGEGFRIFRAHNQEIHDNIYGVLDTFPSLRHRHLQLQPSAAQRMTRHPRCAGNCWVALRYSDAQSGSPCPLRPRPKRSRHCRRRVRAGVLPGRGLGTTVQRGAAGCDEVVSSPFGSRSRIASHVAISAPAPPNPRRIAAGRSASGNTRGMLCFVSGGRHWRPRELVPAYKPSIQLELVLVVDAPAPGPGRALCEDAVADDERLHLACP